MCIFLAQLFTWIEYPGFSCRYTTRQRNGSDTQFMGTDSRSTLHVLLRTEGWFKFPDLKLEKILAMLEKVVNCVFCSLIILLCIHLCWMFINLIVICQLWKSIVWDRLLLLTHLQNLILCFNQIVYDKCQRSSLIEQNKSKPCKIWQKY